MRTYHILNADGIKVAEQEHEDNFRPPLLAGHVAKLVAIDGELLHRKSQPLLGADQPVPDDDHLETEEDFRARRDAEKAERAAAKAEREAAKAEVVEVIEPGSQHIVENPAPDVHDQA